MLKGKFKRVVMSVLSLVVVFTMVLPLGAFDNHDHGHDYQDSDYDDEYVHVHDEDCEHDHIYFNWLAFEDETVFSEAVIELKLQLQQMIEQIRDDVIFEMMSMFEEWEVEAGIAEAYVYANFNARFHDAVDKYLHLSRSSAVSLRQGLCCFDQNLSQYGFFITFADAHFCWVTFWQTGIHCTNCLAVWSSKSWTEGCKFE